MRFLAGLLFLIQFSFAIHALKTRQPYWWMIIIMGFPGVGCLAYYFLEVFPGSREHRRARKAAQRIAKALQPDADLKRRAEELEICGSVENKLALADECMNHRMYAEAAKLYESCATGAFEHDGKILFALARACVEQGTWEKAAAVLARLKAEAPGTRPLDAGLLEARVLEGRGSNDAALAAYRHILPIFVGLEARYRYGACLVRMGQHEVAGQVFNDLIKHAARFASSVEDEQQWAIAARQAITAGT